MRSAAKGLSLLVVVLVVVGAAAAWFLKDDDSVRVETARGPASETAGPEAPLAKPAELDPARPHSAERAEEARAAETTATASTSTTTPTAEYLSGIVVDRNGRPVANAEVVFGMAEGMSFGRGRRMFRFRNTPEQLPDGVRTRSASDGTFRLTKVPRVEAFSLRVDHPDFVIYERGELIVPSSGMELGRITLEPGAMVSGQVFGPGGAKQAGAEVSLRAVEDDDHVTGFRVFAFSAGPHGGRKTTTDADGRFRLTGVPGGKAEVVATAKDMCEAVSEVVTLEPLQEKGGIVLHLERGHTVAGIVRDSGGKPIEGARVSASSSSGDQFARFARMASGEGEVPTGADGRFTLTGLKAGLYEVSVDADGFASKSVDGVDAASGVPVEITLGASAHVAGVVRIKGSGEPAKDVKVQLTPYWGEDAISPPFEMPDAENTADPDALGSFRVEDVEPGQYRVAARGEGTTRAFSAPITIEEDTSVDGLQIEVERGAVLVGRVVDAATGAPIEGAQVAGFADRDESGNPLMAAPGGARGREVRVTSRMALGGRRVSFDSFDRQNVGRAKTDAEGRYEIQHLSAGRVVVDVSHDEYATARSAPYEIDSGEVEQAGDLGLGRGGGVEGHVVGIDGKPRPGDRIDVESRVIKGVTRSAVSDANGWYRIDHVPAGEAVATRSESDEGGAGTRMVFQAIMLADGGEEGEKGKPIVVAEGEVLRLDFSQVEKPYVEGIVTSADGPVAGAIVSVMPDMQRGIPLMLGAQKEVTTGPDGRYRIADLDPGTLRISARHPMGIVPTVANVTLASGSPARQDFLLEGGVIEGDVVAQGDAKSRLEGAVVTLERIQENEGSGTTEMRGEFSIAFTAGARRGGPMRQIRFGGGSDVRVSTDRNGHYRVPWVPTGKYRVSVSRSEYLDSRSDEVEMPANGHLDGVNVAMPPAARLRVQLKSKATGQPLASCPVQLQSEEGGSEHGFTDAEGVATFDSLRPGTWTAIGKKSWQDPDDQRQSVTCEAGQLATITIDL